MPATRAGGAFTPLTDSKRFSDQFDHDKEHSEVFGEDSGDDRPSLTPFISNLWDMVEDPDSNELISWDKDGEHFLIHDRERFEQEILPKYFKHNRFSSFVRQLNIYNFVKSQHHDKDLPSNQVWSRMFFKRGFPELLDNIKRKSKSGKSKGAEDVEKAYTPSPALLSLLEASDDAFDRDYVRQFIKLKAEHDALEKRVLALESSREMLIQEIQRDRRKQADSEKKMEFLYHQNQAVMSMLYNSRKDKKSETKRKQIEYELSKPFTQSVPDIKIPSSPPYKFSKIGSESPRYDNDDFNASYADFIQRNGSPASPSNDPLFAFNIPDNPLSLDSPAHLPRISNGLESSLLDFPEEKEEESDFEFPLGAESPLALPDLRTD